MIVTNRTTSWDILKVAGEVERAARARVRLLTPTEAQRALDVAREASSLARELGVLIRAWLREALPSDYGMSGGQFSQWRVRAPADGPAVVSIWRVRLPANNRSFVGVEMAVEGMDRRSLLWKAGLEHQRVIRWCPEVIRAARELARRSA